jgi:hypothetical protein
LQRLILVVPRIIVTFAGTRIAITMAKGNPITFKAALSRAGETKEESEERAAVSAA